MTIKKIIPAIFLLFTVSISLGNKDNNSNPVVLIKTSKGNIKVMLYNDTPVHRDNFLKLVKEDLYEGRIFHRVIPEFMIQTGWTPQGAKGPDQLLEPEIKKNHIHKRGALAAARKGDKVNPDQKSSSYQFYIVQGKTYTDKELDIYEQRMGKTFTEKQRKIYKTQGGAPHLDGSYTVFGEVLEGMDIVDKIASVKTGKNNKPVKDVKIKGIEILKEE